MQWSPTETVLTEKNTQVEYLLFDPSHIHSGNRNRCLPKDNHLHKGNKMITKSIFV